MKLTIDKINDIFYIITNVISFIEREKENGAQGLNKETMGKHHARFYFPGKGRLFLIRL